MEKEADPKGNIDLISVIESRLKKVHTRSLDLSFNELLDMYNVGEINISPDFQRLFRWSEGTRSRFIESLLLELPVPPIYVIEEEEGRYLLIDGLQRISSYLHLRGKLDANHLEPPVRQGDQLVLTDCDIVRELNGTTFDNLPLALQIRLKRAFIRVEVVRRESDSFLKYHMFKRLNTGGEKLTDQQIRNCTIRLLDPAFNDFIITLSKENDFRSCIDMLSEDRLLGAFDQELVLRFFALRNHREAFKHNVGDFLTEYMELVTNTCSDVHHLFSYEEQRAAFQKTFAVLKQTLGDKSFAFANKTQDNLTRSFGIYHFEAFTIGLQPHLERIDLENETQLKRLEEEFLAIKSSQDFIAITTGGGKNSPGPLEKRISFVKDRINGVL